MKIKNADRNVLRNRVITDLLSYGIPNLTPHNVAVVGGSLGDPEVAVISSEYPNARFEFFGIDVNQVFLDLNTPQTIREKFDLVLCTNVIEHVYHHENFAKNLLSLIRENGIIWCAFPFSDMFHGSPKFYSAGFSPEYVSEIFSRNGGVCEQTKVISSKRLYLFTHLLKDWPSEFRYNHPLFGQIIWSLGKRGNPRPPIRNMSVPKLIMCLAISVTKKDFTEDENYGCGAWVKIRLEHLR